MTDEIQFLLIKG